jgi:NAD(P)-dependent dehydrogenase (short-subunit alcohol dehydrogenase family)
MLKNVAIIGSSGTIGMALTQNVARAYPEALVNAFSRKALQVDIQNVITHQVDFDSESAIESAALLASKDAPLDLVIVATGFLHDAEQKPEKSLKALSSEKMQRLYAINTILPAILAKHFTPHLNKDTRAIFAVLSARVGSISDNQFGGWYSYRASKAALNMVIKNVAIEIARSNKKAIIAGLHPGTVDSPLTKPFQKNVPKEQLFTADYSASKLLAVLFELSPESSGKLFAWDGQEVNP